MTARIPQIRFRGFEGEWKARNIRELGHIYIGLVTTMTKNYREEGTLLIRNSDIKAGKFEFPSKKIYLENSFAEKNSSRMHKIGDIITVHTGDVGTSAVIGKEEEGSLGFATIVTRPYEDKADSQYLATFLNTYKHKQWAVSMSTGDGRTNYNLREYYLLNVPVCSLEEQEKIGALFKTLDRLITLQESQVQNHKTLKQAMLQKMFPKEGAKVPEIRFRGFEGEWERNKIGDLYKLTRGKVLATNKVTNYQNQEYRYPVYSSQTRNDGLLGYYNDYLFENAITWTTDGANAGTVKFRGGKFYCTNVSGVILSEKSKVNNMVAEALNKIAFKHVSRVGNPKLMNNVMNEISVLLPSLIEQEKIGHFFKSLDDIIDAEDAKLASYRALKQALLQKMFV